MTVCEPTVRGKSAQGGNIALKSPRAAFSRLSRIGRAGALALSIACTSCGGGGGGGTGTNGGFTPLPGTYTAKSGVAQKGPLILGSTVTTQELDASLSPTGKQYSYQVSSNLGDFSPSSVFGSQYIGVNATGYYFDEIANAVSTSTVTLNAYSDLEAESVLNVNLLTTLEYQRIQHLINSQNMSFLAARTQAESEVLVALNIPAGSYGAFDTLDISGSSDGDYILAAISSLFVYGNDAGSLSQLIANFQNDIGTHGVITNAATNAALVAAAKGINPATVAANLTKYYAPSGPTFTAANIIEWIAPSGDGVIGRFAFTVPDATPSTVFTFPAIVVSQFAGMSVTVTSGQLSINGAVSTGGTLSAGDTVTVSPNAGDFPNGVLQVYLISDSQRNLAKVSFINGLVSIAVTPNSPSVPVGITQQFSATGTFSDTSTANLTSAVTWSSGNPAAASINVSSGLANALATGESVIVAASGSISGNATLTVTPLVVESIAITPSPAADGIGIHQQLTATGTYSDGSTQNVTSGANWTSDTPSVATVGPTTGIVTGVSVGTAMISATIGSVTEMAPVSIGADMWFPTGRLTTARYNHTATLLPNGKVLVVGGVMYGSTSGQFDTVTASAELYDPVAGNWSPTGSLSSAREFHTATLLPGGKVLVTGGEASDGGVSLASAELYDPAAGTWSTTGSLATSRFGHTATMLTSGKVLVAGGEMIESNSSGGLGLASAELYDPVAGSWSATGNLLSAREYHVATLLPSGEVLVAGGFLSTAELYDPNAGTWSATGSLPMPVGGCTATALGNGLVLLAGGPTAGAELYDPAVGAWSTTGSLTIARSDHTATLLANGKVLVAGGDAAGGPTASVELYDPVAGTWSGTESLPTPFVRFTATLLTNGNVLVAGGEDLDGAPPFTTWLADLYD